MTDLLRRIKRASNTAESKYENYNTAGNTSIKTSTEHKLNYTTLHSI